jgi:Putative DNA-binding domain
VTIPASPGEWDFIRLQQLVIEHDLERARIEYKRELGNGNKVMEAIAALANTFGGVVLIGIDEDKQGADRLTGVDSSDRDRLARMCWDKLVPPYNPEIIPVKLDPGEKYVLVVIIDPDYARRPVMVTQGNKIPVRTEGTNEPADWYRLRELFTEERAGASWPVLPASSNFVPTPGMAHPDLGIRGRLLLTAPRGPHNYITEPARRAILASLNSADDPLTGTGSTLVALMHTWAQAPWGSNPWSQHGRSGPHTLNARWEGLLDTGQTLTEARLIIELTPATASQGLRLTITLEALLTNPRRAVLGNHLKDALDQVPDRNASYLAELQPTPFIHLEGLRRLMLDTLATLWGPLGAQSSTSVLGQPLGPPAQLDMAVFTAAQDVPSQIPIDQCVNFGVATLIPGNTSLPWTQLEPIEPDHQLLTSTEQEKTAYEWITLFGLSNGYQGIDRELARHNQQEAEQG